MINPVRDILVKCQIQGIATTILERELDLCNFFVSLHANVNNIQQISYITVLQ